MEARLAKESRTIEELLKVKLRPLSCLMGTIVGLAIPGAILATDPVFWGGASTTIGIGTAGIIYGDNLLGGDKENVARFNAGLSFYNYTLGYFLGVVSSTTADYVVDTFSRIF